METLTELLVWLNKEQLYSLLRATLLIGVGFLLASLVSNSLGKGLVKRLGVHATMVVRRAAFLGLMVLFSISALRELGFSLNVLLGAAGVFSVAIGFASQTSASNLISGLFLLGERPFKVGDVIKVGGTVGEVLSIDLLSVKLRTFENLYVRLPNETLIKSEITTMTRFPIRRFDLVMGVSYYSELAKVKEVLFQVADSNPLSLEEPKPLFIHQGFGDSSINFQFSVWAKRENFLDLRNTIQEEIKIAFDEAGIEIPFPQRTLSVRDPLTLHLVSHSPSEERPQTQVPSEKEAGGSG